MCIVRGFTVSLESFKLEKALRFVPRPLAPRHLRIYFPAVLFLFMCKNQTIDICRSTCIHSSDSFSYLFLLVCDRQRRKENDRSKSGAYLFLHVICWMMGVQHHSRRKTRLCVRRLIQHLYLNQVIAGVIYDQHSTRVRHRPIRVCLVPVVLC